MHADPPVVLSIHIKSKLEMFIFALCSDFDALGAFSPFIFADILEWYHGYEVQYLGTRLSH